MKESIESILKKLEGLNTIDLIERKLNVKKNTAIKKISELRKLGYVETRGGGKQPRLYRISRVKREKIGNLGLYDTINKNSPIKLVKPYEHRIIMGKLSIEEAIVRAIKSGNFRLIMASLALFNKIKNCSELYQFAKKENIRRKVGALYELTRKIMKVKSIDEKTMKLLMNAKNEKKFIVEGLKSKDFIDLQKKWNVFIPFNKADLERYKE
ncbi:hypothetical protein HYT56_05405 [Candidatus Woesearchaeota archaeon]|nr:hypothetical protein [Candidatus Woesearchaeota archaeon]